ncbi:MAG: alanine--tRNA ligase [Leptospiraceae bacterium]|nr:alanine--tRNA ligase [Leptospiraceae bacterium]
MSKSAAEIKKLFLDFFASKGHSIVPSSSLIPSGDPTLLFTTAGMVQFKPLFTGAVELPYTRATSSQKCLRTTDLENVGKTERHCTFFEMLGNFSFGDYFKEDAILYALEFSLKYLEFPLEQIWITVYQDDDEAIELWVNAGIPREKIVKLGKEDNFWGPAGDSGACGPCSELYLDRGVSKGYEGCGKKESCKPGCSCDRFLEYWNLVFNQFNQDTSGVLHPLKQTGIDTGSGLERVALLVQNVDTVYETDQMQKIIRRIEELSGKKYEAELKPAFRVLTDHSRSVCFAIADGILPDKTGRGYVIRRLVRRANLFARKLGITEAFLYKLVSTISEEYKDSYPELSQKKDFIQNIIHGEEKLFLHTLEIGLSQMESMILSYGDNKVFSGKDSFKLYGTYGFPFEMTKEILLDKGFNVDEKGFQSELEKDRELSRESWKGKKASYLSKLEKLDQTNFLGYESLKGNGKILSILSNEKLVEKISKETEAVLILDSTSFYGESGGQIGDKGYISSKNGALFQVLDTQKENDIILHIGKVLSGEFSSNEIVETEVEEDRRKLLTFHHSGTHLLNGALRAILGTHVSQKASLVSDEYLRFDFSHPKSIDEEELSIIERRVNDAIEKRIDTSTNVLPIEDAKKTGAIAFFDEKYGDKVRVVRMGEYSTEFCGGCHVKNTGDIQYFLITKESSPGAGNRRIEAVSGPKVIEFFQLEFQKISLQKDELNLKLKEVNLKLINDKIDSPELIQEKFQTQGSKAVNHYRQVLKNLRETIHLKKQEWNEAKKQEQGNATKALLASKDSILNQKISLGKFDVFRNKFNNERIESLKEFGDSIKNSYPKSVLYFENKNEDNTTILLMAGKEALSLGVNCNSVLKEILLILDGKGGGKPDLAQGSTKKMEKLEEAYQTFTKKLVSI